MFRVLCLFGVLTFSSLSTAQADPKVPFEKYKLDNGLEVILHQDKSVPIVAVDVWYHVGAGDETPGKSGFAHLFEHMLFQGSEHVGEDKHFDTLRNAGATQVNGTTNLNRTNYYEVLPSHELETALWLESDRMGYLLPLLNQKSLDNQIEVVRNEKRQRVDNVPYGKSGMKMSELLYPVGHPYKYETIGRHEDLSSSSLEDVIGFYKKWYVPANATLAVAGDFEIPEAKKLVEKWFGTFPKTTAPKHVKPAVPKVQKQRVTVEDKFVELRRINYAWLTPPLYQPGDAEMDVLASALGAQGTGRLYKKLVLDEQLAQSVFVYQASAELASTFNIVVTIQKGADLKKIETIIHQEIETIRNQEVSQKEFDRALINFESRFVWSLEGLLARAEVLQGYNHFVGKPDAITWDLDRYRKTTRGKVQEFAKTHLDPNAKIEILTVPKSKIDKNSKAVKITQPKSTKGAKQ